MTIKTLVTTILLTSTLSLSTAMAVECAEIDGKLRPVSKKALAIAKATNSTTCESKSFEKLLELKNWKITTVEATNAHLKAFSDLQNTKREKRAKKQLQKLSKLGF